MESVPAVNPADIEALWKVYQVVEARSGKNAIVTTRLLSRYCSPDADMEAVRSRFALLRLFLSLHSHEVACFIGEDGRPQESVFRAIATVPMQKIVEGLRHQGFPFDVNQFLQLCRR